MYNIVAMMCMFICVSVFPIVCQFSWFLVYTFCGLKAACIMLTIVFNHLSAVGSSVGAMVHFSGTDM